jgi:hypothetical protein
MGFESTFSVDNWHREATTIAKRNAIKTRRWGMRVTVYDAVDPLDDGDWVLSPGLVNTNRQSNDNWLKVADIGATWGGGGGGLITASQGLTAFGTDVQLGGELSGANKSIFSTDGSGVAIAPSSGANAGDLRIFSDTVIFGVQTPGANIEIRGDNSGLQLSSSAVLTMDADYFELDATDVYIFSSGASLEMTADVDLSASGNVAIHSASSGTSVQIGVNGSGAFASAFLNFSDVANVGTVDLSGSGNIDINQTVVGTQIRLDSSGGYSVNALNGFMGITSGGDVQLQGGFGPSTINANADGSIDLLATDNMGLTSSTGNITLDAADNLDLGAGTGDVSIYNFNRSFGFNGAGTFLLDGAAGGAGTFFAADGTWAVPAGGGGTTASNGLTLTGSNITLGGALTANTTITGGDAFDLIFGVGPANRIDLFMVRTSGGFQLESAGGFGRFFINSAGAGEWTTTSVADIVSGTDAAAGTRLTRMSKQTAAAGNASIGDFVEYNNRVSGALAGFGSLFEFALSNSAGILVQDTAYDFSVSWADPTDNANYANFNQRVRVNDVMTDFLTVISSSATTPNISITLGGLADYDADYSASFVARSIPDVGYTSSHIGLQDVDALVINPTAAEDGFVISWNDANQEWELVAGGGGITNTSAINELPKTTDGSGNLATSGIESTTAGNLNLGLAGTAGNNRTITGASSGANVTINMVAKGTGFFNWSLPHTTAKTITLNSLTAAGSLAGFTNSTADGAIFLGTALASVSNTARLGARFDEYIEASVVADTSMLLRGVGVDAIGNAVPWTIKAPSAININQDGGDLIIESGNRTGTGIQGNITMDAFTGFLILNNLPTASAGLPTGALWNNSGVLNIA